MRHPHPLIWWIFGLTMVVLSLLGAIRMGQTHGWGGFLLGLVLPVCFVVAACLLLVGSLYVHEFLRRAGPRFPPCHNGTCTGRRWLSLTEKDRGDYRWTMVDDTSVLRCGCGRDYVSEGDGRLMERLPDGTLKPYMVHRPFRGWSPDDGGAE